MIELGKIYNLNRSGDCLKVMVISDRQTTDYRGPNEPPHVWHEYEGRDVTEAPGTDYDGRVTYEKRIARADQLHERRISTHEDRGQMLPGRCAECGGRVPKHLRGDK